MCNCGEIGLYFHSVTLIYILFCSDEILIQIKEYSQEEINSLHSRISAFCSNSVNVTPLVSVATAVTPVYLLGR